MASTYKTFSNNDLATTRTLLHEVIPITGSIVSGTYVEETTNETNIKNYSHGMFQSVYDYPYLSSSAFFLSFARLLVKDEVQKNTFRMSFATGGVNIGPSFAASTMTVGDYGANTSYKVNSPAGEYAILYTSSATPNEESGVGLLYYQAGICVLTASVFTSSITSPNGAEFGSAATSGDVTSIHTVLTGTAITASCDGFRTRLVNVEFNNTTELNSTIYFCRANHGDFNYSSNPTYLTGSKIRVKEVSRDQPVSYITTVGLYSADKELLAVAKLSEPLKKTPANELTLRVRLDY
jgi:hypothetical protein